jgi:hypothetical protein
VSNLLVYILLLVLFVVFLVFDDKIVSLHERFWPFEKEGEHEVPGQAAYPIRVIMFVFMIITLSALIIIELTD